LRAFAPHRGAGRQTATTIRFLSTKKRKHFRRACQLATKT
jgi:hypothetical protein